MLIKYETSVFTPAAGYQPITVIAEAEPDNDFAEVVVTKVQFIDGKRVAAGRAQFRFSPSEVAEREVGKSVAYFITITGHHAA